MSLRSEIDFLKISSQISENLFEDKISDNTRKKQIQLIMFSLITILLSYSLIQIDSTSYSGIKILTNRPEVTVYAFSACTLYMLIVYVLSIFKDFTLFKYKRLEVMASIREINLEHINSVHNRLDEIESIYKEHEELINARADIFKEYDSLIESSSAQYRELFNRINRFTKENQYQESVKVFYECEDINKKYEEMFKPYEELIEDFKNDKKADELLEKMELLGRQTPEKERAKLIVSILGRHKIIENITFYLEFFAPVLLGFTSIVIAVS